jgi:hypothetical protein
MTLFPAAHGQYTACGNLRFAAVEVGTELQARTTLCSGCSLTTTFNTGPTAFSLRWNVSPLL